MRRSRFRQPPRNDRPSPLANLANLAIFAILPLVLTGVLDLKLSGDGEVSVPEALLLGPVGVVITGQDDVELTSADGMVTLSIPTASGSSPVTPNYRESGPAEVSDLPTGYLSAGRFFELSGTSVGDAGSQVVFQNMLSIEMGIGPDELALAGNDYSRLFIQHFLDRSQTWGVLPPTLTETTRYKSWARTAQPNSA